MLARLRNLVHLGTISALFLLLFAGLPSPAQEVLSVGPKLITSNTGKHERKTAASLPIPSLRHALAEPQPHTLTALTAEQVQLQHRNQIGVHRTLSVATATLGEWASLPNGARVWRAHIVSPGAASLRVHFRNFDVQSGKVWVFHTAERPVADALDPYAGQGLHNDGSFWSGTVFSGSVFIEYEPDPDHLGTELPFEIDKLSHVLSQDESANPSASLSSAAGKSGELAPTPKAVAPCHLDVTCYPEWQQTASAVGWIQFETEFGSATCSGALINTMTQSGRPYFLTAHHCVSDSLTARSIEARFGYQSTVCGSSESIYTSRVFGAQYLISGDMDLGDFSLLLLNYSPAGGYYLGWTTQTIPVGDFVAGVHHPAGSHKRISAGSRHDEQSDPLFQNWATQPGANPSLYYGVTWSAGLTEGGSSGSPLLNENHQIVGMLSFGRKPPEDEAEYHALACLTDLHSRSYYGRFATAFTALRRYLDDRAPAELITPAPGSTLTSSSATFRWSPGAGVTKYWLQVGTSQGGTDLFNVDQGKALSTTVSALPTDGRPLFIRLFSLIGEDWWSFDYAVNAYTQPTARLVTLRLTNHLIYPVTIRANNEPPFVLPANQILQREVIISGPLNLSFEMIRPTLGGTPLGEPIVGYFNPIPNPSGVLPFTISNRVGDTTYFAPLVSNSTATALLMEVNSETLYQSRCNCTVPAFANGIALGYYRHLPASTVRAYRASWGYFGAYRYFYNLVPEFNSGIVRLRFDQAP